MKNMKKVRYMRFLFKVVIVYSGKKEAFDYKNNHEHSKLANFWLDNISKIHCRTQIILLYSLSRLELTKILLAQRVFKLLVSFLFS